MAALLYKDEKNVNRYQYRKKIQSFCIIFHLLVVISHFEKQKYYKMNKIKAAIVGYGNIGRYVLEALQTAPDFEITGIVRRNGDADRPAELEGYTIVKDIKDLPKPDVAILAVPSRSAEKYAAEILPLGFAPLRPTSCALS